MDIETLRLALEDPNAMGLVVAFAAGLVFAFNPIVFASIPVVLAYVTKAREPRSAALLGGAFVAGMLLTHVLLGLVSALGGEWAGNLMGRQWGLVLGPLLILLGMLWTGWLKVRIPWFTVRGKKITGAWGAFLLGVPFTVALCPTCAPALLTVITASAAIGSATFGTTLLLAFGVGRSIPIIIGALGFGWLESLIPLTRYHKLIEGLGGVTLILVGLYLLNEYFLVVGY